MAEKFRIAIVGSGPAGLSAAAHAAKLGVSHVLLEKTDHLSHTIYSYQKKKYVMATPVQLVLRADLGFQADYREAILDTWNQGVAAVGTNVRYNAEVKAISGERRGAGLGSAGANAAASRSLTTVCRCWREAERSRASSGTVRGPASASDAITVRMPAVTPRSAVTASLAALSSR